MINKIHNENNQIQYNIPDAINPNKSSNKISFKFGVVENSPIPTHNYNNNNKEKINTLYPSVKTECGGISKNNSYLNIWLKALENLDIEPTTYK